MSDIDNSEDLIDLRDVMARVEELETSAPVVYESEDVPGKWGFTGCDSDCYDSEEEAREYMLEESHEARELQSLTELLGDCRGNGGYEKWRGDWYPATLIRDSYFQTHAEELAEDIGAIDKAASWPGNCIDWEEAASQLQQDYTSVEFDGVTYWYR